MRKLDEKRIKFGNTSRNSLTCLTRFGYQKLPLDALQIPFQQKSAEIRHCILIVGKTDVAVAEFYAVRDVRILVARNEGTQRFRLVAASLYFNWNK